MNIKLKNQNNLYRLSMTIVPFVYNLKAIKTVSFSCLCNDNHSKYWKKTVHKLTFFKRFPRWHKRVELNYIMFITTDCFRHDGCLPPDNSATETLNHIENYTKLMLTLEWSKVLLHRMTLTAETKKWKRKRLQLCDKTF